MKILVVLYCYPPIIVPASICYLKLVKALKYQGIDVEILTIIPESFDGYYDNIVDNSLSEYVPSGVLNHRVRSCENKILVNFVIYILCCSALLSVTAGGVRPVIKTSIRTGYALKINVKKIALE